MQEVGLEISLVRNYNKVTIRDVVLIDTKRWTNEKQEQVRQAKLDEMTASANAYFDRTFPIKR